MLSKKIIQEIQKNNPEWYIENPYYYDEKGYINSNNILKVYPPVFSNKTINNSRYFIQEIVFKNTQLLVHCGNSASTRGTLACDNISIENQKQRVLINKIGHYCANNVPMILY